MLLSVRLDVRDARLWHLRLLERLAERKALQIAVVPIADARSSRAVDHLLGFEKILHGLPPGALFSRVEPERLARFAGPEDDRSDVVLDLGRTPADGEGRVWRLFFDGAPGEQGLTDALLSGHRPVLEIRDGADVIAAGRLGTDGHGVLAVSLDHALARTIDLVAAALDGARPRLPLSDIPAADVPPAATATGVARIALKSAARLALRSVYRAIYRSPHWRVGWRQAGPSLPGANGDFVGGWTDLPDDGLRFYADPFPILHDDQVTLFVEEYPHTTGKGIISAVAFDESGPIGHPEPVLERPYHLSYPFVFAGDGHVWMIPESGAAGTIDLFRSTRFPGGWVKERTLVTDVVASDATLLEHGGRWWMFATVKGSGSHSDMLCLWLAPHFAGPWTAHPANPVLIDCATARPAGRVIAQGDRLFRPAQDCRATYGAALALAEILELDDRGFRQEVPRFLTPGPAWPGRHLHTLNSAGGFEFIDGSGRARRQWLPRRAGRSTGPALLPRAG